VNKDTIVQFVCFTTPLDRAEFMELWEPYAKLLVDDMSKILLQEGALEKNSNRINYVSQHSCKTNDFNFAFMKGKSKSHFPEHKARIKQAGGYQQMAPQSNYQKTKSDVKVMAFIPQGEYDIDFYRNQASRHLNIYEAYFENCAYGYVMEYFLTEKDAAELLTQIRTRPGVEAAIFRECRFSPASKKVSSSLL
jgi:hypothetical protein